MQKNLFRLICISLLLIFLATACSAKQPESRPPFGQQEITVVMDNNYPPYTFLDEDGTLQGILVDQWALWAKKTGVKVDIHAMDWGEALTRMKNGEFDVIDTIFLTDERAKIYDFSTPYAKIDVPIFFTTNISGITNASSLKGFPVAVKSGDAAIEYLQSKGITDLREYPSYEEVIQAAGERKEIVFVVDKPAALYLLYKNGLQNRFNYSEPLYSGEFHRAVIKGNTQLLTFIEWGFSQISDSEYRSIDNKWIGTSPDSNLGNILKAIAAVTVAVILVTLVLLIWNRTLQERVKQKTAELITAVEDLRDSEEKLRQLAENIREVFWVRDINSGKMLYVSPTSKDVWGTTAERLYENPDAYIDNIYFEDSDRIKESSRMQKTGKFMDDEFRIVKPDGNMHWVRIRTFPVKNEKDEVYRVVGLAEDITERKSNEAEILRKKQEFEQLFQNIPLGVVMLDVHGNFQTINKSFENLFQYKLKDLQGKNLDRLLVPPELKGEGTGLSQLTLQGNSVIKETMRLRKDGSPAYVRILGIPITIDKKMIGFFGIYEDIEERKVAEQQLQESEERFFKIFETNPIPICLSQVEDSLIVEVNQSMCDLTGYSREDMIGKTTDAIGLFESPAERQQILLAVQKEGSLRGVEIPYKKINGEVRESQRFIEMIRIGDRLYSFGLVIDITDQKRNELELQEAHYDLSQAYEATLEGWSTALELRERETAGHSQRVIQQTLTLANEMGINYEDRIHMRRGALLHDIGKMAIPDSILGKAGPLDTDEWAIMRQHPAYAYQLLNNIPYLRPALDIPYCHHEKWDGTGYPRGL
ncbi:MAG: PAS domain S-box protein, partial [Anaerolineaceae bacterium]|nr:PAS domain S-box protein [Anaerolineaceae bacterium]